MNKMFRKNVLLSLLLLFLFTAIKGQEDPYRAEIGVGGAAMNYFGDVNTVADPSGLLYNATQVSGEGGLFFRYRFNKRLALRTGYDYTHLRGTYRYRDGDQFYFQKIANPLHSFDLWGEFNFFDLENNPYKYSGRRYAPFIFAGAGVFYTPGYRDKEEQVFHMSIPFGVGFKIKMGSRFNFNAQFVNRLMIGDSLEGVAMWDNPEPVTVANPMNYDLLSGIMVGISFDFWTRGCDCRESSVAKKNKRIRSM